MLEEHTKDNYHARFDTQCHHQRNALNQNTIGQNVGQGNNVCYMSMPKTIIIIYVPCGHLLAKG